MHLLSLRIFGEGVLRGRRAVRRVGGRPLLVEAVAHRQLRTGEEVVRGQRRRVLLRTGYEVLRVQRRRRAGRRERRRRRRGVAGDVRGGGQARGRPVGGLAVAVRVDHGHGDGRAHADGGDRGRRRSAGVCGVCYGSRTPRRARPSRGPGRRPDRPTAAAEPGRPGRPTAVAGYSVSRDPTEVPPAQSSWAHLRRRATRVPMRLGPFSWAAGATRSGFWRVSRVHPDVRCGVRVPGPHAVSAGVALYVAAVAAPVLVLTRPGQRG